MVQTFGIFSQFCADSFPAHHFHRFSSFNFCFTYLGTASGLHDQYRLVIGTDRFQSVTFPFFYEEEFIMQVNWFLS